MNQHQPYTCNDHTFAVCAYGESPYLEACLQSLQAQTALCPILIATSTPSAYIDRIAEKYKVPVFVNPDQKKGIGADWNFAYDCAETPLVTVAHQDDIYESAFAERMLAGLNRARDPIMFFSDHYELREGRKVHQNKNMRIKRLMLSPLRVPFFRNSRFVRRRIFSLGCPICCPAVTYVRARAGEKDIFSTTMKVSLDWDQWEGQSRKKGAFVYDATPLVCHRIHPGSETTHMIESNMRRKEDLEMFRRFWPEPLARFWAKAYAASEKSNTLEKKQ